jgi:methyl-accepting chemotaxis protein
MKLKYKIIFTTFAVNTVIMLMASITLNLIVNEESKNIITKTEKRLRDSFDLYIRYQVETAYSLVDNIYNMYQRGELEEEEAYNLAINLLREIRYGLKDSDETDGYFWVDTSKGVNLVLYGRKDVEGKNRDDLTDAYGNYIIKDLREKAFGGGGFSDYWFPKLGGDEPLKKRSYSMYHKGFDFVIGTGSYSEDVEKIILKDVAHREKLLRRSKLIINSIYLIGTFMMFILVYFITEFFISRPIKLVADHAEKISKLDLTEENIDKYLYRKDEIGLLERSFKNLSDRLNEIVYEIKRGSTKLSSSIIELDRGNDELATMSSEQAASLEETTSTLEQISAIMEAHTKKTLELSIAMQNTERKATMIREISDTLKSSMKAIKDSSKKIEYILEVLEDITFQTNILALNAAVEAARAGEGGKGFSVITTEIRNLSRKSADASKEISELVKENYSNISKGEELIDYVVVDLNSILNEIEGTNEYVQEITSGADEQRRGIELINNAVSELNDITQTNAGIAEETASVAEELNMEYLKFLDVVDLFKQDEEKVDELDLEEIIYDSDEFEDENYID